MTGLTIPIVLAGLGLIVGFMAQRSIRQGAARFYALERDALLRRAGFLVLGSIALFSSAVGLLSYNVSILTAPPTEEDAIAAAETVAAAPIIIDPNTGNVPLVTVAPVVAELPPLESDVAQLQNMPPTPTALPTEDPNLPTPVPTPVIRRGFIEGTAGSGAYLRESPSTNAEELEILDDGDVVVLIDGVDTFESNGYTWINVRTDAGVEGWVVDLFLDVDG